MTEHLFTGIQSPITSVGESFSQAVASRAEMGLLGAFSPFADSVRGDNRVRL
jgi:hypothetical protein